MSTPNRTCNRNKSHHTVAFLLKFGRFFSILLTEYENREYEKESFNY